MQRLCQNHRCKAGKDKRLATVTPGTEENEEPSNDGELLWSWTLQHLLIASAIVELNSSYAKVLKAREHLAACAKHRLEAFSDYLAELTRRGSKM